VPNLAVLGPVFDVAINVVSVSFSQLGCSLVQPGLLIRHLGLPLQHLATLPADSRQHNMQRGEGGGGQRFQTPCAFKHPALSNTLRFQTPCAFKRPALSNALA
jgi:hypothetical protein